MSRTLAHVGDFTVDNWGDRLYPSALDALMEATGPRGWTVVRHALQPGRLHNGERVSSLRTVRRADPDVVMVGGGDLIRTDRLTVAHDHVQSPSQARGSRARRVRALAFGARFMPAGAGPWLPERGWGATKTALVSVGVHSLPRSQQVHRGLQHIDCAWVRTERAARNLAYAGMAEERILVAPDMVFAHPWLLDRPGLERRGAELATAAGLGDEPPVVIQAAGFHGWSVESVVGVLRELDGYGRATMALGRYAGEQHMLGEAARRAGVPFVETPDPFDVMAWMAHAGALVSTSMHGAIVAGTLGTPVIVPTVAKTADALAAVPAPPPVITTEAAGIGAAVRAAYGQTMRVEAGANREAVENAYQEVCRRLGL